MTAACKKERWTDTTDACPICQNERYKDGEGMVTYRYPNANSANDSQSF